MAWIVLAAAAVWAVFLAPRRMRDVGAPSRWAGLIYVGSVVGMLAVISLGTRLARDVGVDAAQPAVVVMAVGLHFIPFAWAFRAPVFAWLGGTMTVILLLPRRGPSTTFDRRRGVDAETGRPSRDA